MSDHSTAVADFASETHPAYEAKIQDGYIDGYDPVSLHAPHSSLIRTSTWAGMGIVLGSLPGFGALIWGIGVILWGDGTIGADPMWYIIPGAIVGVVCLVVGFGMIHSGRKYYRQYRKETGRVN